MLGALLRMAMYKDGQFDSSTNNVRIVTKPSANILDVSDFRNHRRQQSSIQGIAAQQAVGD